MMRWYFSKTIFSEILRATVCIAVNDLAMIATHRNLFAGYQTVGYSLSPVPVPVGRIAEQVVKDFAVSRRVHILLQT